MPVTREDLENAAFAVGMPLRVVGAKVATYALHPDRDGVDRICCMSQWNPHTDDGDTARLAAKLGMSSRFENVLGALFAIVEPRTCWDRSRRTGGISVRHDGSEEDTLRAWREAVTLCAAAEGKLMREGGA